MTSEIAASPTIESTDRPCTVSVPVLTEWCTQCLLRAKIPIQDAVFTAQSLVQTSLWGIDSHGVARLPHYLTRLAAGSLNPQPTLRFETTGPCTGTLDGDHGLGFVVCRRATDEAITLAKANGLGFVGVRHSSHCGAIGLYGRLIAEAGLIGIVFTHSDAFVAPHRGHQKFLGTNPICISAPRLDGPPVCLDMATSAAAWNLIVNAQTENRAIAPNLAYDASGSSTTDPHAVACLQPMAGHKGYALALMIELLCGPLNGAPWGPNITPMYGAPSARRNLGSFIGAIDPTRFAGGATFPQAVADIVAAAHSQPHKNPDEPVLVPGDDHYACEERRRRSGIPVAEGFAAQIRDWCTRLGVPSPLN